MPDSFILKLLYDATEVWNGLGIYENEVHCASAYNLGSAGPNDGPNHIPTVWHFFNCQSSGSGAEENTYLSKKLE